MAQQVRDVVGADNVGEAAGCGQRGVAGATGHVEHPLPRVDVQVSDEQLTDDLLADADAVEVPFDHAACWAFVKASKPVIPIPSPGTTA